MPTIIEGRAHTTGRFSEEYRNSDGEAGPKHTMEEGALMPEAELKQQREGTARPTGQMPTRTQTAGARNLQKREEGRAYRDDKLWRSKSAEAPQQVAAEQT